MQRSSVLWRLLWLLAAALIALPFGAGAPAQALPQPSAHLHHYVYDAEVHDSVLMNAAAERGPPVACDTHQDRTAVGSASNGVLTSPATATVSVDYGYDGRPQFVQVAQGGNTDAKPVGAPTGQLSPVHPSHVAANTAASTSRYTRTTFGGNRVYQRNDLIDPSAVDKLGRTNLERMQAGIAPLGPDGRSINLHHLTQRPNGAIAEVTATMHQTNSRVLHINPNTIPSGIDRGAFDAWRRSYWMSRAGDF